MNKKVAIIAGVLSTSEALKRQLLEYTDTFKDLTVYGVEDHFPQTITCDLIIYSSDIVFDEVKAYPNVIEATDAIVAKRTVNFKTLDALFRIQKNERVYILNDAKPTTYQFMDHLRKIGLDDIDMVPYFPGTQLDTKIKYAITPGTLDHMPQGIEHVINIGPRLFSLETIHQILSKLNLLEAIGGSYSESYLSKIVNITKRSGRYASEVNALNELMGSIMTSIDEGVLVIDQKNHVSVINKPMLGLINAQERDYVGTKLDKVIHNQDIVNFCIGLVQVEEAIFEVGGLNLAFTRQKLSTGFVIVFAKNIEERILESNRLSQELIKKGHIAKYNFDDIVGQSQVINEAKFIAHKLAKSELTLLLEGETGTGKELFASAIHNASNRSKKAYLAINFSAFSDELIESELFGYEGGAFTGAKKGGKVGLFEQANGGTLLLDEIGDISPKMQTKLLRVLQEGEIMRIGGTMIHSVDVRIIAATNKDLRKMVDQGTFREDLYYRLKTGMIKLPPLRDRKEDIPQLIEHFLESDYSMDQAAQSHLAMNAWRGNVRELKGTIDYMKALSDHHHLSVNELPQVFDHKLPSGEVVMLSPDERRILEVVAECNRLAMSSGRQNIHHLTYADLKLSENQVRARIKKLCQNGYLISLKGRLGTQITEKGMGVLE